MQGDVTFPAGSGFAGRLALYRGSLRHRRPGAGATSPWPTARCTCCRAPTVEGDILVVGGRLIRVRAGAARRAGSGCYWDAAPVLRAADGPLALRERRRPLGELATARTTLPDRPGPHHAAARHRRHLQPDRGAADRLRPDSSSSGRPRSQLARLDLRGILRTAGEGPDSRSDFGYGARARAALPGRRVGIGGRLYSEVEPIEDQPLSAAENGWSAFLLQRDYRDYFERQGGGGSA